MEGERQVGERRNSWHADTLPADPDERRKERNRRAQRVFREKQKKKITDLDTDVKTLRGKVRAWWRLHDHLRQPSTARSSISMEMLGEVWRYFL